MNQERILDILIYINPTNCAFSESIEQLKYNSGINLDFQKYTFENYHPSSITLCINLSDGCNLKCDYCFNSLKSGKSIDLKMVETFLENMFNKYPSKEKYYVDLSGKGEPLLFLDKILKIKKMCNVFSNKLNREVLVSFVCNGTLLSKEVANILQKNGILFGVSLDGNKYIHNLHRKDKYGNDTYDTIIDNIKNIDCRDYIGCATTLTKDVFSLVDSIKELGEVFNTISYKPARNCDDAINEDSINDWLEEYNKLVLFLLNESINNNNSYVIKLLNGDDYFAKFLKRILLGQRVLIRCDGGLSRITLDNDGNLYTCPSAFGNEKFNIGTYNCIEEKKQIKMLDNQNAKDYCSSCSVRYLCGGECMIEKELSNGHNKVMCKYKKHLILLAIYFVYKLSIFNPNSLKKLIDFSIEVNSRRMLDNQLMEFLKNNPQYNFIEGKEVFDSFNKRY